MRFPWQKEKPEPEPTELFLRTRIGPIPVTIVPKPQALAEWTRRQQAFPETSRWPLIIGEVENLELFNSDGFFEDGATAEDILAEAEDIEAAELIAERAEELLADYEDDEEGVAYLQDEVLPVDPATLDPNQPANQNLAIVQALGKATEPNVALVELPLAEPWQLFALRPFGDWNEVPSDADLTSILRHWFETYRAVPCALLPDTLELWLPNPIKDPATATKVALEQYAVCVDIVDQGTETVQALAQALLNSHVWFFWWD
jgi:hypothetical protein